MNQHPLIAKAIALGARVLDEWNSQPGDPRVASIVDLSNSFLVYLVEDEVVYSAPYTFKNAVRLYQLGKFKGRRVVDFSACGPKRDRVIVSIEDKSSATTARERYVEACSELRASVARTLGVLDFLSNERSLDNLYCREALAGARLDLSAALRRAQEDK